MPRLSTPRMVPTPRVMFLPGMKVPGGREHADETGTRVRRAAHDLHRRGTVAGIDHADPQPIRVGVLLGGDHARDGERRQRLRLVLDVLDLKPDHGELVGELFQRLVGFEMFLQPGEGEFHGCEPLEFSVFWVVLAPLLRSLPPCGGGLGRGVSRLLGKLQLAEWLRRRLQDSTVTCSLVNRRT